MFDANKAVDHIVKWIQDWFEQNGKYCTAVVGLSGGKDSTIVAALCVKALGKEKVHGVMMPCDGANNDLETGIDVATYLGIEYSIAPIGSLNGMILNNLKSFDWYITNQTKINLPARIRMTVLYAISQSIDGRVANTCNLSEDWVGYATKYGDGAGDFSPISQYTVTEVRQIGKALGIPDEFVYKVPTDGLCGQTDEDKLGFTYDILDKYIRTGICEDKAIMAKIDDLHEKNRFKLLPMEHCPYYEVVEVNGNG